MVYPKKAIKNLEEKGAWAYSGIAEIFLSSAI